MAEVFVPDRQPVVGILGGMGPEATVDLMRRVIKATPAQDDADHIHMLVDNNPAVPSRIAALIDETGPSPLPELVRMAKGLVASGASMLAMPCNTAHYYAGEIAAAVPIPFLDMVALTATRISEITPGKARQGKARVGLLASSAVFKIGLYERALCRYGMSIRAPERQDAVMAIIRAVKSSRAGEVQRESLAAISDELIHSGVDIVLVACTELSILSDGMNKSAPVIDALDVLAEEIVASAKR